MSSSKPRASDVEKANLAVSLYMAKQARNTAVSTEAIAKNTAESLAVNKQMLQAQAQTNRILDSIDYGVRNLEQSAIDINKKLAISNDFQEKQLLQQKLESDRVEWRDQRDQLEKQIEREIQETEQGIKNLLHCFDRRVQLLTEIAMSSLELYFFVDQMLQTTREISPNLLKDVSDKKYRDEVEDVLKVKCVELRDTFTDQDEADLKAIIEIEREDENADAAKFLKKIKGQLAFVQAFEALRQKLGRKTMLKSSDKTLFRKEIKAIRQTLE